jgi:hypothetical protein
MNSKLVAFLMVTYYISLSAVFVLVGTANPRATSLSWRSWSLEY